MVFLQKLRPDFSRIKAAKGETRSAKRLAIHFHVERRLAKQLASSSKQERSTLYSTVYQQLFAAINDHPQHRSRTQVRQDRINAQVAFLRKLLGPSSVYVEVGCGDAALTKAIAPFVASSIGVDVTPKLVDFQDAAPSFSFCKTNGVAFEIPTASVDVVYSNQLMEHLHTEDAAEQLEDVFRILKPGGRYICSTPNRLTGPHDISCYFGYEPIGLHMREYDHRSLSRLFRRVGFSRVLGNITIKGFALSLPIWLIAMAEAGLETLPRAIQSRIALSPVVSNVAGVLLTGMK